MNNQYRKQHPDRIPVVVQRHETSKLPNIDRNKYLVPKEFTIGHFMFILRKRITLNKYQSIYLFLNNNYIPPSSMTLLELDDKFCKNKNDVLQFYFAEENTFGLMVYST